MTDFITDLRNHIRARYSIIQLVTYEETRALTELLRIATDLKHDVYIWSASLGVMKDGKIAAERSADLKVAIDFCEERARSKEPHLFIFLDVHGFLGQAGNPVYRRRLKDMANNIRTQGYRANCIILGCSTEVPADLQKEIVLLDFPLPDRSLVKDCIDQFIASHKGNDRVTIDVDEDTLEHLVEAALGLTLAEIENCLARALVEDLRLDASDVSGLLKEKQQVIRKSGILDYIDTSTLSLDAVGGLENLKRWLSARSVTFSSSAKSFGLAPPKGILLTGIPGCGKSLTAKCVSAAWRLPLLKLDMGKVFQGIVGSSEANIRQALAMAEAVSPSILWIDEIEKGLAGAGGGGDGGTAVRVFGTLLTWMQEKTSPVFVFATANDISTLPPELLRKGRFDEIFFVDLPSSIEREAILSLQIAAKGRDLKRYDIGRLAELSGEAVQGEGVRLSGAELEAWVNDAMVEAYRRHAVDPSQDVEMVDFEHTISRIVPMAKMRKEEISKLRSWASKNAVAASFREAHGSTMAQFTQDETAGRALDF